MNRDELREVLETLHDRYNRLEFIESDPIRIPRLFSERNDIEIGGLLAATIAWGNRRAIVKNARRLMRLMDDAPYDFTINASDNELNALTDFVHRTFNGGDCIDFVRGIRHICTRYGGIGAFFESEYTACGDMRQAISRFRSEFWRCDHRPRAEKHLSSIDRGSACKRLCMYIRWMVRQDDRGVDFGLWKHIPPSAIFLPLDVHTASVGRSLGLLCRRQNDWKAVEEITAALREFDPEDPVRYDFALFGAGIDGFCKER